MEIWSGGSPARIRHALRHASHWPASGSRRGVNTMPLVGFGFSLLAFALWQMSQWTLSVSMSNEFFPMVVSGVATGLIFPTMSAATLSRVERERMGYAASLYNMMRNMGAAVGISMVTNLLNSQEQIHQSYLTQHFTIFDAWKIDNAGSHMPGSTRLNLMHGLMTHQAQGLGMVYGAIQQQASLLAYNDIYRLLAMMSAVFFPTFLLVRKHQTSSGAPTSLISLKAMAQAWECRYQSRRTVGFQRLVGQSSNINSAEKVRNSVTLPSRQLFSQRHWFGRT